MYRKNCDKCSRSSYSSNEFGEWHCPICGHDLTSYPLLDAITFEKIPVKVKELEQFHSSERRISSDF